MGRVLLGLLLGIVLAVGSIAAWTRFSESCLGRCGDGTSCRDHQCVVLAAAGAPVAAAAPTKERRRRGHRGSSGDPGSAAPEITLHPGDEKMVMQGDALGRPEHIDLTATGDDGRELAQEDLDRIVRAADPAISRCITDAVGDAPLDSGKVEVGLRVEKSGQVSRVRVEGPALMQQKGLTRCVRSVIGGLRFPRSGGATVATYPYELK